VALLANTLTQRVPSSATQPETRNLKLPVVSTLLSTIPKAFAGKSAATVSFFDP
jgi:hypothetical protein